MKPWQLFNAARKVIGANTVAHIFNRSVRAAHDWAQDPICTEVRCKSPLELLHTLFERMDQVGLGYAARAGIVYLSTALEYAGDQNEIKDTLPTIQEELLADYAAIGDLQRAISSHADMDEINRIKRAAIEEIERTVAKYSKG